ncbi:hypothetical protein MMC26_000446 [Xylographa opegraphella]|nr:hypothetical protein [Xylographa opegraphella]
MLGGVTALGFCHGSHTGQCVVHAVSGSALIGVGVLLLFIQQCERYRLTAPFANSDAVLATLVNMSGVLVVLADWISKETHQRAILDLVITGLVYLCVHAFITWLAWMSDSQILRKASSGVLLVIGGWFLATHSTLPAPSILHKFLGFSMQTAGVAQILAAGFTGTSKESAAAMTKEIYLLRLLTAYSLGASGLLFIGANKEQLQLLSSGSMPTTPFVLLITNGTTKAEQSLEEVQAGSGHLLHIRNYNLSHLVDIALV